MEAAKESGDNQKWVDVALTKETKVEVKSGVTNHAFLNIAEQGVFQVVPEIQEKFPKALVLKPNKTYAFRVAGVNSMGVGPWSEVASFKMITPGSPKAPINVKISERKCDEGGAAISWEISTGLYPILEFRVFLAINCENPPVTNGATTAKNSIFKQVYKGSENRCDVKKDLMAMAVIDMTGGKPAIIFRIVGRNEMGYGPATEVRWLQDKK